MKPITQLEDKAPHIILIITIFFFTLSFVYCSISLESLAISAECYEISYELSSGKTTLEDAEIRASELIEDLENLQDMLFKPWKYPWWKIKRILN